MDFWTGPVFAPHVEVPLPRGYLTQAPSVHGPQHLTRSLLLLSLFGTLGVGCGPGEGVYLEDEEGTLGAEIVNGSEANIEQNPWQVSLQTSDGTHFCGGSLVAQQWVLTAQHCVDQKSPREIRVVAGITELSQSSRGQFRSLKRIVRYPDDWNQGEMITNDVALLELSKPIELSPRAQVISLVSPQDVASGISAPGKRSRVTGWGVTGSGWSPNKLRQADLPILSKDDAYRLSLLRYEWLSDQHLPAGADGKAFCHGDSGGPLVVRANDGTFRLAGVVSFVFGDDYCSTSKPVVFARVSHFHSWITSTMKN